MKNFLPILTLVGCSALIVGCDSVMNVKSNDCCNNIKDFKSSVLNYSNTNPENITKTVGNYSLSIIDRENDISLLNELTNNEVESISEINSTNNEENDETIDNNTNENINNDNIDENMQVTPTEDISTLYYLSQDIEENCNSFCELKEKIMEAISESEKLSEQLKSNELTLTREQRLFINEQSSQLKNLSRQLSNATRELSYNLSDLSAIMRENNQDINDLSVKYLIVLDNLINGNEMLENGLSSLYMINNLMQLNGKTMPSNNTGRILYGFQDNNNPPIIKEYYVDENGELKNKDLSNTENNEQNNSSTEQTNSKKNIDTYKDTKLTSNIDTYGNNRRNIDSFFNTALLDNEFMYGTNNQFGGMYGNPNLYQYQNYEATNKLNNTTNNEQLNNNTQDIVPNQLTKDRKEKKKFKLKSNIDTYRDESTPSIKTKIQNFKSSINSFFNRASLNPKNNIEKPIYKLD